MIYDVEKYVNFLCKHKITPNQFTFCLLLAEGKRDIISQYIKEVSKFSTSEIDDLVNKGFIEDFNKVDTNKHYEVDGFLVTPLFKSEFYIDEIFDNDPFDELMEVYPDFLIVNNTKVAAKALTLQQEKELRERYNLELKKNKVLHKKILDVVVKTKKENGGYAQMKIDKFIVGKVWNILFKSNKTSSGNRTY